jgi:hypothetical protein
MCTSQRLVFGARQNSVGSSMWSPIQVVCLRSANALFTEPTVQASQAEVAWVGLVSTS